MLASFLELTAWIYYACFLLLGALLTLILWRRPPVHTGGGSQRNRDRSAHRSQHQAQLRAAFFRLALALWLWQLTLFAETRTQSAVAQLSLGRLNFTAMVWGAYFAWRFVGLVSPRFIKPPGRFSHSSRFQTLCRIQTLILAALTWLTPWIDAAERVAAGHAISTYGPLFPLYGTHVAFYWLAALVVAGREWHRIRKATAHRQRVRGQALRAQLGWIAGGMLTTGAVALVTNVLLPYAWGDFRWCDLGALSTLLFLLAIAYATLWHRLFDLRVFVRQTLLYGILLAFVLGSYSSALFVIAQFLTESAGKWTQFAVLFIAFSLDPLRRFLEKRIDGLLFPPREGQSQGKSHEGGNEERRPGPKRSRRAGTRLPLELIFPWRS